MSTLSPYPDYKLSGIEWLDAIPSHWIEQRGKSLFRKVQRGIDENAGTVTAFRDGQVTLRTNRRTQGFTEAIQEIGYQGVRAGDLVIHAMDAFAGAVGVSESDGKCSPVYSVCVPHDPQVVEPHYMARCLREIAANGFIQAQTKGIRERSTDFRFESFGNLRFPLPPLDEQRAIADFLDRKDAEITRFIASRRRMIALLEEKKQAIINQSVTRGLDPTVPMKHSGVEWLGEIPAHWEAVSLRRLLREPLQYGAYAPSMLFEPDLPRYVRITDITPEGRLSADGARSISDAEAAPYILEEGDVLLARSGATVGKSYLHSGFDGVAAFAGYLIRARTNPTLLNPEYLTVYLGSGFYWQWIKSISIQATIENVSAEKYAALSVPCPPIVEQCAIAEHLHRIEQKFSHQKSGLLREIELVQEYRTRLSSDVVTGKVRVG